MQRGNPGWFFSLWRCLLGLRESGREWRARGVETARVESSTQHWLCQGARNMIPTRLPFGLRRDEVARGATGCGTRA